MALWEIILIGVIFAALAIGFVRFIRDMTDFPEDRI